MSAAPLEIVLLTVRPRDTDFRYHLARELHALGHHVRYVFLKRHPELEDLSSGERRTMSLPELVRWFAGFRRQRVRPVVFNSTNLAFPGLCALLRAVSGTRWVFDMHDDLLYEDRGLSRARKIARQRLLLATSDVVVHAAPALQQLFPQSQHIGNGSSLQPLPKVRRDPRAVLVLASLDRRFDFDLMRAVATRLPGHRFDIYGRVTLNDPAVAAMLDALLAAAPNIAYHQAYSDPELPGILARYLVAFAPYKVGIRFTDYIEPLRFHHCLASDTGLVSTAIPQALRMADHIELVRDADEAEAAFARAAERGGGGARSWREVAERLVAIIRERRLG